MSIENVVAMEVEAPIKKEKKSKKSKKTVEPVVEDEVTTLKRKAQEEHEDAPKKKKSKKNKEAKAEEPAAEEPVAMETEEKTEKKEKKKKSKKNKEAAAEEEKVEEVVEEVEGEKKDKKKKKKSKSEPAPEESPEEDEAATPTATEEKAEEEAATEEKAEEPKAEGAEECLTVFVGGLPWSAEEETVKKDFEECGEMTRFAFLTDRETGRPKGSCFIDYATTEGVKKALEFNETDYGGRTIYVREATPGNKGGDKGGKKGKKGDGKKGKGKGKGELRTPGEKPDGCTSVVVKNFTYSTTEDALWKLFEGCGEISRLKLLTDRETGESKGIAFVDFATTEGVDEAIKKCNQEVEGRAIFVDYSGGKGDGKKGEGKKGDGKKGKGKKGKGKKGESSAIKSANQGSIVEATGEKKTFDDSDSD